MRETVTGLLCPERAAIRPQELRLIKGAMLCCPALPPVVEMKVPSADQDNLLKRDCYKSKFL